MDSPQSLLKPLLFNTVISDLEKRGDESGDRRKWYKIIQDSQI